jgi:hypothetical protein
MIDDVVPVRSRPMLVVVVDVFGRRMNVQLGCLHVHQRETRNQREREQPMEGPYHRVPNIVLHPGSRDFSAPGFLCRHELINELRDLVAHSRTTSM